MSKLRSEIFVFVFLLVIGANIRVGAQTVTTPRVFMRGSFVYVVDPAYITFLSMDTRGSHILYHAPDPIMRIVSVAQDGDVLWLSTALGAVIALDMQRGVLEEYGRAKIDGGGHIAVDRRHVWVARPDTLHRMNKTTLEWKSIPMPFSGNMIVRGVISFNDHVHIVAQDAVYIYGTDADEWLSISNDDFIIDDGEYHMSNGFAFFARGSSIYRYDPSRRRVTFSRVRGRVHTVFAQDANVANGRLIIGGGNRIYELDAETQTLRALASLPPVHSVRSLALFENRVTAANKNGIALYTTPFDFDFAPYPEYITVGEDIFTFVYEELIVLYTNGNFVLYDHGRRLWSVVNTRKREQPTIQGWSENGAFIPINEDVSTTLLGGFTLRQEPTIGRDSADEMNLNVDYFSNATITARTEDVMGRTFDLTIDNAGFLPTPQKGFMYRGADDDVFDRARYGLQNAGQTGMTFTQNDFDVMTEGGAAFFSGNRTAQNRDRAILSGTVGGGHILSQTEWREYRYNRGGNYHIEVDEISAIVPATVRFYVDGVPLSESDFIYNERTRTVRLLRRDRVDPTSIIQISFARRILPNESGTFEALPENHFGRYGFAQGTVSPRSWINFDAGVLAHDAHDRRTPALMAGVPVEYRSGASRSLLFHPQISYDNLRGAHAASFDIGARERRAFGSYSGAFVSRGYNSLDRQTFGGANVFDEHDINAGYDILNNLRANFRALQRTTGGEFESGTDKLSYYELRSQYSPDGAIPNIELSASRREMETHNDRLKEMFEVRAFDASSPIFGSGARLRNVGYDFAWSEYNEDGVGRGRTVYGALDLMPSDRMSLRAGTLYRQNPNGFEAKTEIAPALEISGINLLRGFDVALDYSVNVTDLQSGGNDILTQRTFGTYVYPGEFAKIFGGVIFYLGYESEAQTHAPNTVSPLKYAFLTDDYTSRNRTASDAGVAYFPMENLLLSSLYTRRTDNDISATHGFYERAKYWFANGSAMEARLNYGFNDLYENVGGNALYEHNFGGGVLAGLGAFFNYIERNEIDITEIDGYTAGPQFLLSISKSLSGSIRHIENSHILRLSFHEDNSAGNSVDYALYLRLRMPPNVSAVAQLQFSYNETDKLRGGGALYLHAGF